MGKCVIIMRHIRKVFFIISAGFITAATALAAVNAILRFLGVGLAWADELYIYLVVLMVYLALPRLEGAGDQLCITAIDSWVKGEKGKRILNYFRQVITTAALIVLSYYGFQVMLKAFVRNQVTYILMIPKGILYLIAAVSIVVTILALLVVIICSKGEFDNAD